MDASVWVAKTGLTAQQRRMTVIANNLANVNTVAFKKDRAVFEDLLYQNLRQPGASADAQTIAPTGLMMGTGSRIIATEKMHKQGNMIATENALDVAIQGRGMFQILQADGTFAYTRDGGFKLNDQGQLVTASGQQLVPAINIPNTAASVTIGRDGTVSVELANGGGRRKLGQFKFLVLLTRRAFSLLVATYTGRPQLVAPWKLGLPDSQALESWRKDLWRPRM